MNRRMLTMAAACVLAAVLAAPAGAQDYPTQTIKMISSFGAGGGSDIIGAHPRAAHAGEARPERDRGKPAGRRRRARQRSWSPTRRRTATRSASRPPARSSPRSSPRTCATTRSSAFDWIGQIATAGLFIVVRPDSPYKDIKSLVAAAKANPGKIVFGSPGFAATQHLAGELFKQTAGIDMLHVPYRTSPEVLAALLSKNVDVVIDTITALLGQVQSGQVTALAVTGKDRFPTTPNIPPAIGVRRGAELRRQHLVRPVRAEGHAAAGRRQAQQDAQRDACRSPRSASGWARSARW